MVRPARRAHGARTGAARGAPNPAAQHRARAITPQTAVRLPAHRSAARRPVRRNPLQRACRPWRPLARSRTLSWARILARSRTRGWPCRHRAPAARRAAGGSDLPAGRPACRPGPEQGRCASCAGSTASGHAPIRRCRTPGRGCPTRQTGKRSWRCRGPCRTRSADRTAGGRGRPGRTRLAASYPAKHCRRRRPTPPRQSVPRARTPRLSGGPHRAESAWLFRPPLAERHGTTRLPCRSGPAAAGGVRADSAGH